MKILHVLNTDRFSGAENVACQIIEIFKDFPDVEMIYCSRDGAIRETLAEKKITFEPISRVSVSEIRRLIKKHKPDVLHCHDFNASTFAALAAKKVRVVSHLHHNAPWMQTVCLRSLVYRCVLRRFVCVMAVSKAIFDDFLYSAKIGRKLVIGNPVDTVALRRNYCEKTEKDIDLLYMGRLADEKNPMRFIQLVEQLVKEFPNLKAALVGDGDLYEQCEDYIVAHDLVDTITMHGFQKKVDTFLNRSKIGVNTSRWEGFGLSVIENLAFGMPVTASAVGGLNDIVNESCGQLCVMDEDFLDEIRKLLKEEDYYQTKQKGALQRAEELENIEEYRELLWNVYRKSL